MGRKHKQTIQIKLGGIMTKLDVTKADEENHMNTPDKLVKNAKCPIRTNKKG